MLSHLHSAIVVLNVFDLPLNEILYLVADEVKDRL